MIQEVICQEEASDMLLCCTGSRVSERLEASKQAGIQGFFKSALLCLNGARVTLCNKERRKLREDRRSVVPETDRI